MYVVRTSFDGSRDNVIDNFNLQLDIQLLALLNTDYDSVQSHMYSFLGYS